MIIKLTTTAIVACIITSIATYTLLIPQPQMVEIPTPVEVQKGFVNIDRSTLDAHIKQYTYLSSRAQKLIVSTIIEEAIRYDINPIIVYSLINIESNFRYWITHSNVVIPVNDKKVATNAIGASGVVWELWGSKLIEAEIAETQSDLYDPVINIRASAFILADYMKLPLLPSTRSPEESAMLRYYGVTYTGKNINKDYLDRIEAFMGGILKDAIYSRK